MFPSCSPCLCSPNFSQHIFNLKHVHCQTDKSTWIFIIYWTPSVSEQFGVRAWVCVSSFQPVRRWGRPSQPCWDVQSRCSGFWAERAAQGSDAEKTVRGGYYLSLFSIFASNLARTNCFSLELNWLTVWLLLRQIGVFKIQTYEFLTLNHKPF